MRREAAFQGPPGGLTFFGGLHRATLWHAPGYDGVAPSGTVLASVQANKPAHLTAYGSRGPGFLVMTGDGWWLHEKRRGCGKLKGKVQTTDSQSRLMFGHGQSSEEEKSIKLTWVKISLIS